jgi:hypothetical protein
MMISKIKALGLAFVAVTAMSAVVASTGQASSLDFGVSPAILTGESENEHVFTINRTDGSKANAICGAATFEGTTTGLNVTEEVVTATYSTCKLLGMVATVQMQGCRFLITNAGQPAHTGLMDIAGCTAGKSITIKSAFCTVEIPPQTGISHVVASNIGGNNVTLEGTLTGLTITQIGTLCPDGNNHHSKNGSASGNLIMGAYNHLGTSQLTQHGHQYNAFTRGTQVSLVST